MNIIGEGLADFVSEQINVRQKIYGSINRSTEQLVFLNAKTAFVKLISAVNITDKFTSPSNELNNIKDKLSGSNLAKDFVLFNGTQDADTRSGRSGIARNGSIINSSAYGLGGLEYGLRGMPGIISADIKSENRGSLKTATVRIKAFNRVQFEIVDLLYLRLGFGILLEWGNTMYYDNSTALQKDVINSLEDKFLNGDYTVETIQTAIQEKRLASAGNYDALFGKVVNFSWEFADDGSYDITVIVRSIGDVIESLKVNVLIDDSLTKAQEAFQKFVENLPQIQQTQQLYITAPTDATSTSATSHLPPVLGSTGSLTPEQLAKLDLPPSIPGT